MKRAVIFSLISILLCGFIILLFWSANAPRLDVMSGAARTRVTVMDQHLTNWDSFTRDATELATRAILEGLTNRIDQTSTPVSYDQVIRNITQCLRDGSASFMGSADSYCYGSVNGSLFHHLNAYAALVKQELGVNTTYDLVEDVNISDWAPFEVVVTFGIKYLITDTFASWNRTEYYNIIVSVEGLPDPLFNKYGAQWMYAPSNQKRNLTFFTVPRDRLTPKNVSSVISQEAYVENVGLGPTYLERLTLNLSLDFDPTNSSGIETLLDPSATNVIPVAYINKSFVAHQIFADLNFTCGNKTLAINRTRYPYIPDDFRLDVSHIGRYGFNGTAGMLNYSCAS